MRRWLVEYCGYNVSVILWIFVKKGPREESVQNRVECVSCGDRGRALESLWIEKKDTNHCGIVKVRSLCVPIHASTVCNGTGVFRDTISYYFLNPYYPLKKLLKAPRNRLENDLIQSFYTFTKFETRP